jgi:hypothetical protein
MITNIADQRTWRDCIALYDTSISMMPTSGNDQLDIGLTDILSKIKTIRDMGESGFTQMDSLIIQLNGFGDTLKTEIVSMQNNMQREFETTSLGGTTVKIGSKIDELNNRIDTIANQNVTMTAYVDSAVDSKVKVLADAIEQRMKLVELSMTTLNNGLRTVREKQIDAPADTTGIGSRDKRSILEYKSIQDIQKIGNNKTEWKEWIYQLKNTLRPILGTKIEWEFWMDLVERNYIKT